MWLNVLQLDRKKKTIIKLRFDLCYKNKKHQTDFVKSFQSLKLNSASLKIIQKRFFKQFS